MTDINKKYLTIFLIYSYGEHKLLRGVKKHG